MIGFLDLQQPSSASLPDRCFVCTEHKQSNTNLFLNSTHLLLQIFLNVMIVRNSFVRIVVKHIYVKHRILLVRSSVKFVEHYLN